MEFRWDSKKATKNLKKHKISFQEAATVFDDPDHSFEEQRFLTFGTARTGKFLIVSHTEE